METGEEDFSVDCTEEFKRLAASIKKGDILKNETFNLQTAISATELFSPKMDSLMQAKRGGDIDNEVLNSNVKLSPELVVSIFDNLLNLEHCYYEGQPLPQTVLTCVYAQAEVLQKMKSMAKYQTLYALVMGCLRGCAILSESAQPAQILFDEDFCANDFGVTNAASEGTTEEYIALLHNAIAVEDNPALLHRLKFKMHFLSVAAQLEADEFSQAGSHVTQCAFEFSKFASHAPEPGVFSELERCFDSFLHFHKLFPSPPRPLIPLVRSEEDFRVLSKKVTCHLEGLAHVCLLKQTVRTAMPVGGLIAAFQHLSSFYNPRENKDYDAYVRTRMARALLKVVEKSGAKTLYLCGEMNWESLIRDDACFFGQDCLKALQVVDPQFESATLLLVELVHSAMLTLCMNRARQRRRLVHRLDDFGNVLQRVEFYDAVVKGENWAGVSMQDRYTRRLQFKTPLGNYVASWCMRLMTKYLELGLLLDLYDAADSQEVVLIIAKISLHASHMRETVRVERLGGKNSDAFEANGAMFGERIMMEAKKFLYLGCVGLEILIRRVENSVKEEKSQIQMQDEIEYANRFVAPFVHIALPLFLNHEELRLSIADESQSNEKLIAMCESNLGEARKLAESVLDSVQAKSFLYPGVMKRLEAMKRAAMLNLVALGRWKRGDLSKGFVVNVLTGSSLKGFDTEDAFVVFQMEKRNI